MKSPNKLYRKLGGKRSVAGQAFALTCSPARTLKSMFGRDIAARDAAEAYNLSPTRENILRVMSVVRHWGRHYKGPSLAWMFRSMSGHKPRATPPTYKPDI